MVRWLMDSARSMNGRIRIIDRRHNVLQRRDG